MEEKVKLEALLVLADAVRHLIFFQDPIELPAALSYF
jgi:hypothetical protein